MVKVFTVRLITLVCFNFEEGNILKSFKFIVGIGWERIKLFGNDLSLAYMGNKLFQREIEHDIIDHDMHFMISEIQWKN